MKLEQLSVRNFKSIRKLDADLNEKIKVLIAPNGSGKTTFIQALTYALTGDLPDTPVSYGAEELSVGWRMDHVLYSRSYEAGKKKNTACVAGRATTGKGMQNTLESITGQKCDTLKIVSSSKVLEAMKPAELSKFLMDFVPEKLNFKTLTGYMDGITPKQKAELQEILRAIYAKLERKDPKEIPDAKLNSSFGLDVVEDLKKAVNSEKLALSKYIRYNETTIKENTKVMPNRTASEIDADLEHLMTEAGNRNAAIREYAAYKRAVNARDAQIANLRKAMHEYEALTVTEPDVRRLADIRKEKENIKQVITQMTSAKAAMAANVKWFDDTLKQLSNPSYCPISNSIVCKTDKRPIKASLEGLSAKGKQEIAAQEAAIRQQEAVLLNLQKEEDEIKKNEILFERKKMLGKQIESAQNTLVPAPEPVAEPKPIDPKLYEEKKRTLQNERKLLFDYEKAIELKQKMVADLERLEDLKALAQHLDSKSPSMYKIIHHYTDIFKNACNKRADALKPGMEIEFYYDKGLSISCRMDEGKPDLPFHALSSGERMLVTLLITDMINQLTGVGILVLDDMDKLDAKTFGNVMDMLIHSSFLDDYDHVFVSAVDHTDTVDVAKRLLNSNQFLMLK